MFHHFVVYSRQSQHTLIIHRRLNTATFPCTPHLFLYQSLPASQPGLVVPPCINCSYYPISIQSPIGSKSVSEDKGWHKVAFAWLGDKQTTITVFCPSGSFLFLLDLSRLFRCFPPLQESLPWLPVCNSALFGRLFLRPSPNWHFRSYLSSATIFGSPIRRTTAPSSIYSRVPHTANLATMSVSRYVGCYSLDEHGRAADLLSLDAPLSIFPPYLRDSMSAMLFSAQRLRS